MRKRTSHPATRLPGFTLTIGFTIAYLSAVVLLPLSMLFMRAAELGPAGFWEVVTTPRVVAAYKLSFGAAFAAAGINTVFGAVIAWCLVRYSFPGRRIVDAMVDLPFALPTAVSGIALATLYSPHGWIGRLLAPIGVKAAYSRLGIAIALVFIGIPFVVRTLQPALEDLDPTIEEAAASLGASRAQTLRRVILPMVMPSLLTGFTLAFARALGEYGSVVFISGNMPMKTEIVPLLIIAQLEQYQYEAAAAIGLTMLGCSILILLSINFLQWRASRFGRTQ
ncbi:MAG: sulfate ABC transporter permease subunit CysT [Verrucomicrobiota bacterium]|jgi:sulfate transport system permease protein|nr:sulfate ABC transporter permease subunit CysT [Verrucomicrobiota bacterium]